MKYKLSLKRTLPMVLTGSMIFNSVPVVQASESDLIEATADIISEEDLGEVEIINGEEPAVISEENLGGGLLSL